MSGSCRIRKVRRRMQRSAEAPGGGGGKKKLVGLFPGIEGSRQEIQSGGKVGNRKSESPLLNKGKSKTCTAEQSCKS